MRIESKQAIKFPAIDGKPVDIAKGTNEVTDKLRDVPYYKTLLKAGVILEISDMPLDEGTAPANLKRFTVAAAVPIIQAEDDINLLTAWKDSDDRKGIQEEIEQRIMELSAEE